jgi:hypothetical protein
MSASARKPQTRRMEFMSVIVTGPPATGRRL